MLDSNKSPVITNPGVFCWIFVLFVWVLLGPVWTTYGQDAPSCDTPNPVCAIPSQELVEPFEILEDGSFEEGRAVVVTEPLKGEDPVQLDRKTVVPLSSYTRCKI